MDEHRHEATVHHHDHLHGRPMATAKLEGPLRTIWFASERSSGKIEQIKQNPNVYAGYTRYPEGQVPDRVGDKWDEYWSTRIIDENGKVTEIS